jgi:hypothetical protein
MVLLIMEKENRTREGIHTDRLIRIKNIQIAGGYHGKINSF